MENDFKPALKSFWQKPEGKTGTIFGIGILGLLGWGVWSILPFLITFATSTLHLMLLLSIIGAITYIALDRKIRTLVWYMYKVAMKKITGAFIDIDPVSILKTYIESLQSNRKNMDEQIIKLKGQMVQLKQNIDYNTVQAQQSLKLATKAKENGKNAELIVKTRKAGRLQNSNDILSKLHNKMELTYRVLSKMYDTTGYLLEDTIDQVNVREREYIAIKASSSALKSAMAIINGDEDKKAIFDQAMETMAYEIGQKVGEMERFIDISKTFMDSIDLQNGIYEEDGMKMLEKWEKESDSILLGNDGKKYLIELTNNESEVLDLSENQEKSVSIKKKSKENKYTNILN